MSSIRGNGPRAVRQVPKSEKPISVTISCVLGPRQITSRTYEAYPSTYLAVITRKFESEMAGLLPVPRGEEVFYAFGPKWKKVTKDKRLSFKDNGMTKGGCARSVAILAYVATSTNVAAATNKNY
ncbi:hypothetical protein TWF481_011016 [Arthrobotrys musiformis]|uniref:Uncharacterized protein n=1 Tax=Arthrobotrys musiformis TaxID=47236 RepID=A0AAV9VX64_9PEZI